MQSNSSRRLGLVLTGGGARGAYQAGVLKALHEISHDQREPLSIKTISGISAGSVNAVFWAAHADDPSNATQRMVELWRTLTPDDIFKTGFFGLLKNSFRWFWDVAFGGIHHHSHAQSLLDTSPLANVLERYVDYSKIKQNLSKGIIDSVSVTATNYMNSRAVSFVQTKESFEKWTRYRRHSEATEINSKHILASCAIPLIFPSVPINGAFYGDGGLRNLAPLSPAIHLGSKKLIIIGVRKRYAIEEPKERRHFRPSIGHILNVIVNSIVLDTIDVDVERLERLNKVLRCLSPAERAQQDLKIIDYLWFTPSRNLGALAGQYRKNIPPVIRYLFRGLGSAHETSDLISYLLFDAQYCSLLIELGYEDTMRRKDEVLKFLEN